MWIGPAVKLFGVEGVVGTLTVIVAAPAQTPLTDMPSLDCTSEKKIVLVELTLCMLIIAPLRNKVQVTCPTPEVNTILMLAGVNAAPTGATSASVGGVVRIAFFAGAFFFAIRVVLCVGVKL